MKTNINWADIQSDVVALLKKHGALSVTELTDKVNQLPKNYAVTVKRSNLNWQLVYWTDKTETIIKRSSHGRYFIQK